MLSVTFRAFHTGFIVKAKDMVRILNVAEKNDAAKSLADIMSRGAFRRREGISRFNKIYEFEYNIFNQNCQMTMTSVSGHLLNFEFVGQYRKWNGCNPVSLFDAPVQKHCPENYNDIKRSLEKEIRGCQSLIIWTDGDREGENIGFEIIQVCKQVKQNIRVYRARFSEITPQAVARAIQGLQEPDQNTSDAVDVRQELDLRIGAAFTRFQTLRLKRVFPEVLADQLISYGSCQFPTLGFVVERYKQVQAFIPEPFWKIKVSHDHEESHVEFNWKRQRLFDHMACLVLYEHCLEKPEAKVMDVKSKPKSRWRPAALDTVELEKLASRKLRINAKETMKVAEKLYTQGFISYPRTETNIFPKDLDLVSLVQQQTQDPNWGAFAQGVLNRGPTPRNGTKSDQAHPPIHPTKYTNNLQGNEARIYEFVVRHFLACCSQDAQGQETTVDIEINEEKFSASGLMILARNYLEVYVYDKWNAKVIPTYSVGEIFNPSVLEMTEGETSAPPLLTEADLIALMDKHGIGTDATHADHIETIKSRMYVGVRQDGRFVPGELGMGLVDGYDAMGFEMSKPNLRSELEADLKRICEGQKDHKVVLAGQIQKYREVFMEACNQANKIDEALSEYFGNAATYTEEAIDVAALLPVCKCSKCGCDMTIKAKKDGNGFYLGCAGFPDCREVIWFPQSVTSAIVSDTVCEYCQPGPKRKIKFKFKKGSVPPYIPLEYEGCIGGCDQNLKEILDLGRFSTPRSNTGSNAGSQTSTTNSQRPYSTSTTNRVPLSQSNNPGVMGNPRGTSHTRGGPASRGRGRENRPATGGSTGRLDSAGLSGGDGNAVVCGCGEDARMLTVRKEGPNTGRQFYGCAKPPDSKCGFFLWADEGNNDSASSRPQAQGRPQTSGQGNYNQRNDNSTTNHGGWDSRRNSTSFGDDDADVKCNCGIEAKSLIVQKEGNNKGRPFYACAKPQGQGCGFFQWGDEPPGESRGATGARGKTGARGAANNQGGRGNGSHGNKPKRKITCGECHQEGHTKRSCPLLKSR